MSFIFMSVKEFSDLVTPLKVMVTLFTLFTSSIAPRFFQHWFLLEKVIIISCLIKEEICIPSSMLRY